VAALCSHSASYVKNTWEIPRISWEIVGTSPQSHMFPLKNHVYQHVSIEQTWEITPIEIMGNFIDMFLLKKH